MCYEGENTELYQLFEFEKTDNGYELKRYLQKDNPDITEIKIPSEYNGGSVTIIGKMSFFKAEYIKSVFIPESVKEIGDNAFADCFRLKLVNISEGVIRIGVKAFSACLGLKAVVLPKSLEILDYEAFEDCSDMENVTFSGEPSSFGQFVFFGCNKLPAKTILMGMVCSCDISRPLDPDGFKNDFRLDWTLSELGCDNIYLRKDIFELAVQNNCFRGIDSTVLLKDIIRRGLIDRLVFAEKYGMLSDKELLDKLIVYSAENSTAEITAWFLDYKNRKFGFDPEDKYVL